VVEFAGTLPIQKERKMRRVLTFADSGKMIEIKRDRLLEVSLDVNATAGYFWKLVKIDAAVLRKVGEVTKPGTKALGSRGKTTFFFEAKNSGEGKLKLHYLRPWETKKPLKTFEVTVKVR
jgi:predicted secreted protein